MDISYQHSNRTYLAKQAICSWKDGPRGRYSSPGFFISWSSKSLYSACVSKDEEVAMREVKERGESVRMEGQQHMEASIEGRTRSV